MDYEIAASGWKPQGSPGWMSLINITLSSFDTSARLIPTGILIFGDKGTLALFKLNYRGIKDLRVQHGLTLGSIYDASKYADIRAELSHQSLGVWDSHNRMVTPCQ